MNQFDDDVANEAVHFQSANLEDLAKKVPLIIHGLVIKVDAKDKITKETKQKYLVDNLSFGMLKTECFGLLGKFIFKIILLYQIININLW
jgi:hypothetical protein